MKKRLVNKAIATSAIAFALTGCNVDELPPKTGNSFGQLAITGSLQVGETLTASVRDANGVDTAAITYTWTANGSAISGETSNTLQISEALAGASIGVSVSYTDNDNFSETATTTAGSVPNEAAVISGELTASVESTAIDTISGMITVNDADGADEFVAQTSAVAMYGTFSITSAGAWIYAVDTNNEAVATLSGGETLMETITIESADGTTASLVITISGFIDLVAKISDSDDGDTGELYYKFSEGMNSGKITLSYLYGENETETGYLSLYDSAGSTKSLIGDLQFNEGELSLRGEDGFTDPGFTPGEWYDIELTWNTASLTGAGTYTVSINNVVYGPYTSQNTTPGVAVESFSIRLASNSKMSTDAVYVDDLMIYSDETGTNAILIDTFQEYAAGDTLVGIYGSRTFEAVVNAFGVVVDDTSGETDGDTNDDNGGETGGDAGGDTGGETGNKYAQVTDNMDNDAGELRYKLATSDIIAKGKLTASFNKSSAAECTIDGAEKDGYIAIYGSSTSSYNAIVDLRIDGSDYDTDYAIRHKNEDGNKTLPVTNANFVADTWTEVEITWDATSADGTTGPLVQVSLDGTPVADAWNSYSESLGDVQTGMQTFVFKLGDTGSVIPNCFLRVDNVKLYSIDGSGVETIIFEDDYESYAVGVSLDTDNSASPYNSSSAEVVVAAEQ
jgi:VCBS repeat-containing protein